MEAFFILYLKPLLYIILLLISIESIAQARAVKIADFKGEQIFIKLEDIDHINLSHNTNGKIEVSMSDYQENPYALSMEIIDKKIFIISKSQGIQKEFEANKFCAIQPFFASYSVSVPKGATIYLNYAEGNLKAKDFNAHLFVKLNKGHLEFEAYQGFLDLELFSGSVNLSVEGAAFDLFTSKGQIINKLPIEISKNSLKGVFNNSDNSINIRSIQANIELSAVRSQ